MNIPNTTLWSHQIPAQMLFFLLNILSHPILKRSLLRLNNCDNVFISSGAKNWTQGLKAHTLPMNYTPNPKQSNI